MFSEKPAAFTGDWLKLIFITYGKKNKTYIFVIL